MSLWYIIKIINDEDHKENTHNHGHPIHEMKNVSPNRSRKKNTHLPSHHKTKQIQKKPLQPTPVDPLLTDQDPLNNGIDDNMYDNSGTEDIYNDDSDYESSYDGTFDDYEDPGENELPTDESYDGLFENNPNTPESNVYNEDPDDIPLDEGLDSADFDEDDANDFESTEPVGTDENNPDPFRLNPHVPNEIDVYPPVHLHCHCHIDTLPSGRKIWRTEKSPCGLCARLRDAYNADQNKKYVQPVREILTN